MTFSPHADPVLNGRLLVIDDDFVQRTIIQKSATKLGLETIVASSYEQAAALLSSEPFDVLTLDLSLGERDGVEMLRLLSRLGLTSLPIVVISGCEERILNSTRRVAEALGLTLTACLTKPLQFASLREALSQRTGGRAEAVTAAPKPDIGREGIVEALGRGEFVAEFQPKIDLRTGKMVGAEALARWPSKSHGRISPSVFIPLVEQFGLMQEFTRRILDSAISRAREFLDVDPHFTLAVNVPSVLLDDLSLPDKIEERLRIHDVPPDALIIEITEDFAMSNVSRALDILVRLRIKGIGAAIDDFGTGYSSLAALARLPFSELKIDQSFVRHCDEDPDMMKIVEASVGLARAFNMKVVAEGIDALPILSNVVSLGCDIGQGYLFAPSLPAESAESWMRDLNNDSSDRFSLARRRSKASAGSERGASALAT